MRIDLQQFLDTNNFYYELYNHKPIYTNEDALVVKEELGFSGSETKALFLKDKKKNYFVYLTFTTKQTDFKALSASVATKLSIVQAEQMEELTNQKPGAVTPIGYTADIPLIIDQEILTTEKLVFAPGRGDQTMVIKTEDLLEIIKLLGNKTFIA